MRRKQLVNCAAAAPAAVTATVAGAIAACSLHKPWGKLLNRAAGECSSVEAYPRAAVGLQLQDWGQPGAKVNSSGNNNSAININSYNNINLPFTRRNLAATSVLNQSQVRLALPISRLCLCQAKAGTAATVATVAAMAAATIAKQHQQQQLWQQQLQTKPEWGK